MDMLTSKLQVSPYGFSAVGVDELGASEYTLVSICQDASGSVSNFKPEIEKCIKEIVAACVESPPNENLMLRLQTFGSCLEEVHGFKPLGECNANDYNDCININGMTALYDSAVNSIEALNAYGKDLVENDFDVNGILIVVTDGDNNSSTNTVNQVKEAIASVARDEHLESLVTILVGVNIDAYVQQKLDDFQQEVGFTQFIALKDADKNTLAKLAQFVSNSVSSQSSALGTGGLSVSLNF